MLRRRLRSVLGAQRPGKVTAVRFWSLGDVTRVAIEVSSDFHYKSDRLTDPDRLFFDIQGAKPEMVSKGMHVIAVGDALLKQIRIAETQPGVTRVVLDLEQRRRIHGVAAGEPRSADDRVEAEGSSGSAGDRQRERRESDHGIAGTSRGSGSRSTAAGSRYAPNGGAPRVRGPVMTQWSSPKREAGAATV